MQLQIQLEIHNSSNVVQSLYSEHANKNECIISVNLKALHHNLLIKINQSLDHYCKVTVDF